MTQAWRRAVEGVQASPAPRLRATSPALITATEATQLERMTLVASTVAPAGGPRDARARGHGLEVEDYRRYQPGDDPRVVDWTVHARLRQLVVRVFRAEGHVRLHVLVDVSGSMGIGTPSKLACATKLAAALSYVAVGRRDGVALATLDSTVRVRVPTASGRPHLLRILDLLGATRPYRVSALDRALAEYAAGVRGPGMAIVMSDFLESTAAFDGLRHLLARGLMPVVVQVLAEEDVAPDVSGEVEISDIEDARLAPFVVDATATVEYLERLGRIEARLADFCIMHGLPRIRVTSQATFADLLQACVRAGVLAPHA